MQATLKLPMKFDTEKMLAELEAIERGPSWLAHPDVTVTNKGDWSAIAMISATGETASSESLRYRGREDEAKPTELLRSAPYFQEVVGAFRTTIHRARLMSLLPGTVIREHRDYGAQRYSYERGFIRVHIPIRTHDRVAWRIRGEKVPMLPGEAWYINVCEPHSVENHSDVNRVHLVLDMKVNDWIEGIFPAPTTWDRLSGVVLRNFESPFLDARTALVARGRRIRQALGDAGLRRLKGALLRQPGLHRPGAGKLGG